MYRMNNEFNHTDFISRLSGLESKVEEKSNNTERRLQKLETDNETLNRLVVVAELQQKTLETVTATLDKIGDSNNNISHEIQGLKEDVNVLNVKVENIESTDKISIRQFFRKYIGVFLVAFVGGLAGFVLVKFGLR